jgi:SAM-dependent methyltransferase
MPATSPADLAAMPALRRARRLAGRVRRSPRLRAALRRMNTERGLLLAGGTAVAARSGRSTAARGLAAATLANWALAWREERRRGHAETEEHVARMRRLRPEVLQHFYVTCIGSMERELEEFPAYDRHKHMQRYRLLADLAAQHVPQGGVVVDVGCATGMVLDAVHARRGTTGIGFDLSPNGVRDRAQRAGAPVLAQAVVEQVPLRDEIADVVVFSEVIEHLIDAYIGLREVNRITRPGGVLVLTTNNNSEFPLVAPWRDPLTWVERLVGRHRPEALAFRNITWHLPINDDADPLPRNAPTYAPHFWFCFAELRDLAADAGFELLHTSSFEFPPPQSKTAMWMRTLTARHPRRGDAVSDVVERLVALTPGLRMMGTHHCLVFRKVAPARPQPRVPWWPAALVEAPLPGAEPLPASAA